MGLGRIWMMAGVAGLLALPVGAGAQTGAAGKSPGVKAAPAARLPAKATARCNDNTWSLSASQQGACSSHGGIAVWFGPRPKGATARCNDGTYWLPAPRQGACSDHGGVSFWYPKPKPKPKPSG